MNRALRKISFFIGLGILIISMYWSQDGWNFDVAGQSGYTTLALFIGWFLAIAVTCVEFVFSSNYRELNPTLILFGMLAYGYSIYTNYEGILHFQGNNQSHLFAAVLAAVMDGVAEPLIAWSLYESLSGDVIGNAIKALISSPDRIRSMGDDANKALHQENRHDGQKHDSHKRIEYHKPYRPDFGKNRKVSDEIRQKLEKNRDDKGIFDNLHGANHDK